MRHDRLYLTDIVQALPIHIADFIAGADTEEFAQVRASAQRCRSEADTAIGEAAARISDDTRTLHPREIPWRR